MSETFSLSQVLEVKKAKPLPSCPGCGGPMSARLLIWRPVEGYWGMIECADIECQRQIHRPIAGQVPLPALAPELLRNWTNGG